MNKKNTLNYPKSAAMGFFFQGTQERVRNNRGKRAISVRAIEVLLYCGNVYGKISAALLDILSNVYMRDYNFENEIKVT